MTDIVSLAATRLGEEYILGSLIPKDESEYHGPWDCAEFASWLVYQLSGKLYGCANNDGNPHGADGYTGYWKRDADKLGHIIPVDIAAKTPGAFVLRYSGPGLVGHIVISDGKGGTIEAHSHKDGVIRSKISGRRWNIGILVPWLTYELSLPSVVVEEPQEIIYRWKTPPMEGLKVKEIQEKLGSVADGIFGVKTYYALKTYQNKMGLVADGEAGPKTLSALGIKA